MRDVSSAPRDRSASAGSLKGSGYADEAKDYLTSVVLSEQYEIEERSYAGQALSAEFGLDGQVEKTVWDLARNSKLDKWIRAGWLRCFELDNEAASRNLDALKATAIDQLEDTSVRGAAIRAMGSVAESDHLPVAVLATMATTPDLDSDLRESAYLTLKMAIGVPNKIDV